MDIIQDGFGLMLAFGDLAWVPFTYSTQARYLVDHPVQLGGLGLLAVLVRAPRSLPRFTHTVPARVQAVNIIGFYIFRSSNSEKDAFRCGVCAASRPYRRAPCGSSNPAAPRFKNARVVDTARGTKLLASGWWGVYVRHRAAPRALGCGPVLRPRGDGGGGAGRATSTTSATGSWPGCAGAPLCWGTRRLALLTRAAQGWCLPTGAGTTRGRGRA
jgi:hypothetical protein